MSVRTRNAMVVILTVPGLTVSFAASGAWGQIEAVSVDVTASDFAKPAFFLVPQCSNGPWETEFTTVSAPPCTLSATHNLCTYFASSSADATASLSGTPNAVLGLTLSGSSDAATSQQGSDCAANGHSSGSAMARVEFLVIGEPMAFTLAANGTPTASGTATNAKCNIVLSGRELSGQLVVSTDPSESVDTLPRCGVLQSGVQYLLYLQCHGGMLSTNPPVFGARSAAVSGQVTINFFASDLLLRATAGPGDCTLTDEIHWNEPAGGPYEDPENWNPAQVPVQNGLRSDTAIFDLASGTFIPVSGSGATAGQWIVSNSAIEFSGRGQVFSTSLSPPSLSIYQGGQLRLVSGASLDSVHASVGASGATNSVLELKGGGWTNTESARIGRGSVDVLEGGTASTTALTIGSGNGPGSVHVTGDISTFNVTGALVVGDTTAGTLEIDKGSFSVTPVTTAPQIGRSATGTVTVRGDYGSSSSYGVFLVNHSLIVGDGARGRLNVESGGIVNITKDLVVSGYGANPAGEVVVDAQGGTNSLDVLEKTLVNATELQEIVVKNGGRLSTKELFIGDRQIRPGTADVTLRGASGIFPTLTVGTVGGGGAGTFIGQVAPGQLNVEDGARAELNNGLRVGSAAQGIVSISSLNHPPGILSTLTVTGETQVGIGAPGFVQLDAVAQMENNGDMKIGLGGGNPSGSVNLADGSYLRVNGVLSVGASGIGLLNILSGSAVRCDTLLVGGNTLGATGIIVETFFSYLTVDGNTQVGVGSGHGEILLADPEARLVINGTMTIGNPNGGPGGGAVALVGAMIEGTGRIVVNPNGSLIGTGTVAVIKVDAGGIISPGLSPGTLTIDGDLEILPGGALIMEYAGLNPGEFDVLHVTGQTTLGGKLEVHFRGGFSPEDPAVFIHSQDFIEADQGVTGDYDQRIYAFPDLFADFDDDGDKDLRDVAAFQNCFGLSGGELEPACARADWEHNGVLNEVEVRELTARLSGPQ